MTNEIKTLGWSTKIQEYLQQKYQVYISRAKPQVHKYIPKLFKIVKIFTCKMNCLIIWETSIFQVGKKNNEGKIDTEVLLLSYTGYQNVKGSRKLDTF